MLGSTPLGAATQPAGLGGDGRTTASEVVSALSWRRNLIGLYISVLVAVFGIAMCFLFTPLFLANELGLHDPKQLAFWTGISSAGFGISRAITSPLWGAAADRFGRKPMLIRAMVGGAVAIGLIAFAREPIHVVLATALFAGVGGTVPVATAIAAHETPRAHVGFAVGVIQSGSALGQSIGPLIGSGLALAVGLRTMYPIGAVLYVAAVVPVLFLVHESSSAKRRRNVIRLREALRLAPRESVRAIAVLLLANALLWMTTQSAQPLIAVQIVSVDPTAAVLLVGISFGAASFLTALSSFSYSWVAARIGFRSLGVIVSLFGAVVLVGISQATSAAALIGLISLFGVTRGVLIPLIASMIGLEAPQEVQATVLGLNVTAMAVGVGAGPLLAGSIAATNGVPLGLMSAAAISLVLTGVFWFGVREPSRDGQALVVAET